MEWNIYRYPIHYTTHLWYYSHLFFIHFCFVAKNYNVAIHNIICLKGISRSTAEAKTDSPTDNLLNTSHCNFLRKLYDNNLYSAFIKPTEKN